MYSYIYDSFLQNKKFDKALAKIEGRLTDLGLSGKICRLSPLKSLEAIIKQEIKKGSQTIVIVGDDKTLVQSINIIVEADITLGYIPVGSNTYIAQILGIPKEENACDILSARRVTKLDLGQINGYYFLTQVEAPMDSLSVRCGNKYTIKSLSKKHYLRIINLRSFNSNPQDGLLEVVIEPPQKTLQKNLTKESFLITNEVELSSPEPVNVLMEQQKIIKTPLNISVSPHKLKLVVGKQREF